MPSVDAAEFISKLYIGKFETFEDCHRFEVLVHKTFFTGGVFVGEAVTAAGFDGNVLPPKDGRDEEDGAQRYLAISDNANEAITWFLTRELQQRSGIVPGGFTVKPTKPG
jgi:hypothetical protein